jgi:hypothetical protein
VHLYQGRQSIPKSVGGGADSKLGRSGAMLIFFLILVHLNGISIVLVALVIKL